MNSLDESVERGGIPAQSGAAEFPVYATFFTSAAQRDRFRSGELVEQWAREYPFLFDEKNRLHALHQCRLGYHFVEWLTAIQLFETRGYLSLIGYLDKKMPRRWAITTRLLPAAAIAYYLSKSINILVYPDMLVYSPDFSECFFCEVKGPRDYLRQPQITAFREQKAVTGKAVWVVQVKVQKLTANTG